MVYLKLFKIALIILPLVCSFSTFDFIVARPEVMKMAFSIPIFLTFLLFFNGRRSINLDGKNIWSIILFLGFASLSIFWGHNKYWHLFHLIPLLSSFIAAIIVVKYLENLEELFRVFSISGALVAFVGIVVTYFDLKIFNNLNEYGSTFGNKNAASQFIILTIPMALGLFIKRKQIIPLICLGVSLSFILFAQSRQAWLSLLMIIIFGLTILIKYKKFTFKKAQIRPLGFLIIFIIAITTTFSNPKHSSWENIKNRAALAVKQLTNPIGSSSQGSNERVSHWVNTLLMIKASPIVGVGLGNWYIQYPKYHSSLIDDGHTYTASMKLKNLHNDHLEILATLGIIGFILWLHIFYRFFNLGFQLIQKDFVLISSSMLSIVAYMTFSSFSFPYKLYIPLLVIFSIGLMLETYIFHKPSTSSKPYQKAILLTLVIISLGLGWQRINFSHNFFKAQALTKALNKAGVNKDIVNKSMMEYAENALKYNKDDVNSAIILASGYFHFKKNREAYQTLVPFTSRYPYHESLLHNLGFLAFHNKDFGNTIRYWEEALKYQKSPSYQKKIKTNLTKIKRALYKGN